MAKMLFTLALRGLIWVLDRSGKHYTNICARVPDPLWEAYVAYLDA